MSSAGTTLTRRTSCVDQFPKVLPMSYWFINIIFHSGTYILCGLCRFLLECTVEYFSELSPYIKCTKLPLVNIVLFKIKYLLTLKVHCIVHTLAYYANNNTYNNIKRDFREFKTFRKKTTKRFTTWAVSTVGDLSLIKNLKKKKSVLFSGTIIIIIEAI